MNMIFIFLPLFFTLTTQFSPFIQPNFIKQDSSNGTIDDPDYYFEVSLPLVYGDTPACTMNLLNHSFTNITRKTNYTVSVPYNPPPATCHWSHAAVEFRAKWTQGKMHEGIVGVWIGGIEIFRTSTAIPGKNGGYWFVWKQLSEYSSVFAKRNIKLTVRIENIVAPVFTDVYRVNISFLFYPKGAGSIPGSFISGESEGRSLNRKLFSEKDYETEDQLRLDRVMLPSHLYDTPADLIIPVSGTIDEGFWFKIEDGSDVRTANVQIPKSTYKAVLELYVSFHGDDEYWYMNPPDSYIEANNLPAKKVNGAYREVLVTIDGKLVGTVIPFPVISPGGINPLFWKPVVSIGAFDLPSYDVDLTSYLRLLLDNQNHSIGFQVADGVSFWLVDANLHLWLDGLSMQTMVDYEAPTMEIEREYEFKGLDGEFSTEAKRSWSSIRWVESNIGVLKTKVTDEIKFKNKIKFKDYATRRELEQTIKTKTKIKITNSEGHSMGETKIEKEYPMKITVEPREGPSKNSSLVKTTVTQSRYEKFSDERTSISSVLKHDMNCIGWMMEKNNIVVSETTENHQNYSYMDDRHGCYSRKVDVVDGDVITDETTHACIK
ncbi:hypothetical protein E3N88_38602 [Mikania micrantha]|uniref:Peptide N-acetyl-beta-D-glucosaminyl asparaginase amidase A N-terminal domain-containing protein n=1 Tax=Mikania micrantha TaxID=192012 RepID=A0A5N6LVC0_9ASTR|nr:hypothetical protein E3N88_38602 [Mikania micrantha]